MSCLADTLLSSTVSPFITSLVTLFGCWEQGKQLSNRSSSYLHRAEDYFPTSSGILNCNILLSFFFFNPGCYATCQHFPASSIMTSLKKWFWTPILLSESCHFCAIVVEALVGWSCWHVCIKYKTHFCSSLGDGMAVMRRRKIAEQI